MNFSPEDKIRHSVVPPNLRCVWMSAGILSYQLCDRQFDCDDCPLDAAMRMHFPRIDPLDKSKPREHDGQRPDMLYSRNHCWFRPMVDGAGRIGIEPGFASALRSPKAVVLPTVGQKLKRHDWCAWIVLEGDTIPLRSPLTGKVCAVNSTLNDTPSRIFDSPLEDGWLFDIEAKTDEPIRSHLMRKGEALKLFDADVKHFQGLIADALRAGKESVGMTAHDGGEFLSDAAAMLGGKRYAEIVRRAFGGVG